MTILQDIINIDNQIKQLKKQINKLEKNKINILQQFYNKNKNKIIKYTPYKNNSDILITKNDIECENDIEDSDYEISTENSTE